MKPKQRTLRAADLFSGAGGTSSGLSAACQSLGLKLDLLAVNHWPIAISSHSKNHELARHLCASLDSVDPRQVVPGGRLDLLIAAPECIFHSRARGGKPINDQLRASPWLILRWLEAIHVEAFLIENVPDFRRWGPLGANGKPLKRRKGETYRAFLTALRALNYTVEDRVLRACDYGDPTIRERLFIIGRRGQKPIRWPEPTHSPDGATTLFGPTRQLSTGKIIPTRWIGEQHVREDLGRIPSFANWARCIRPEPWMGRAKKLDQEDTP